MNKDLQLIKSKYGEDMMHYCRSNFSSILETDGLLFKILSNHFDFSKELYNDMEKLDYLDNFRNYIYSFLKTNEEFVETIKTPEELLSEAGYDFYECKNERDIQSFRNYFAKGEELCTFNGGRLNQCYVFFAVKKDVESIKREDFEKPDRQDLYGTSVISIQFSRGTVNTLSIKNRYNHTVKNPDATFSNNLENIAKGLTKSFSKEYNLNIKSPNFGFDLKNYVFANDGKFYKYDHEINNIYYCYNNVIIDNFNVKKFDKDRFFIFEHYILDMKEKTIRKYDEILEDSFTSGLNNIKKIKVEKENKFKKIFINDDVEIDLNENNHIIYYSNPNLKKIENGFLCSNISLEKIDIENVCEIGNYFLLANKELKELNLPNVTNIGNDFCRSNNVLENMNIVNAKEIGDSFLCCNTFLRKLNMPNLEKAGEDFFSRNAIIDEVDFTSLKSVGRAFMTNNNKLEKLYVPNLYKVDDYFFSINDSIKEIYAPKLTWVNREFLKYNNKIEVLDLENLYNLSNNFMSFNNRIKKINLPKVTKLGSDFLSRNQELESLSLPNVEFIGSNFLRFNKTVKSLVLPKVAYIDPKGFMDKNNVLYNVFVPNLPKENYEKILSNAFFMKEGEYENIKSGIKKLL